MDKPISHQERLASVVDRLDLDALTWRTEPWPEDELLGILQVVSRLTRLQGVLLEAFLKAWLAEFAPECPLDANELQSAIDDVILEDRITAYTRFLMRKHRKGETPVSLNELAKERNDPKSPHFRTAANRLIKRVQDPMHDTCLWHIKVVDRNGSIGGYQIRAGDALTEFMTHLFEPEATRIMDQFYAKYRHGGN